MMKTPNLTEFKAWAKAHRGMALIVLAAQARAECKREQVDAYVLPIFKKYDFRVSAKWRHADSGAPIDKPRDLYLSDQEDLCAEYFAECDNAHRERGFIGHPDGHCPALVADHEHIKAKNAFLQLGCDLFGLDDLPTMMDDRKKMLDLLIGACLCEEKDQRKAVA